MTASEPSDNDQVIAFLAAHLTHERGSRIPWDILYEHYASWWADGAAGDPLTARRFGEAMAYACEMAPIRVRTTQKRVWCLHVRLIDPGVKALPAPGATAGATEGKGTSPV